MKLILFVLLCFSYGISYSQKEIKLSELKKYIGKTVKVRGKIFGGSHLGRAEGVESLNILYIGAPSPNETLDVLIMDNIKRRMDYNPMNKKFVGGMAVIIGKVGFHKNKTQIVISDPKKLEIFIDEEVPASEIPPIEKKH